jgi:hypothetical protein
MESAKSLIKVLIRYLTIEKQLIYCSFIFRIRKIMRLFFNSVIKM